jgi:hypothetical protein
MQARTIRGVWLPGAVAVAVAALAGCSSGYAGPATDGPLKSGTLINVPLGAICAPGGRTWAFGWDQFTNHGRTTVVLDRAALLRPRNEHLVGSIAVPGDQVVGARYWPPKGIGLPPGWKHRQPVPGFRLAPGKSFNLVLGVAAITKGRHASSQGGQIYYHDSSGRYLVKSYSANIIEAGANTGNC